MAALAIVFQKLDALPVTQITVSNCTRSSDHNHSLKSSTNVFFFLIHQLTHDASGMVDSALNSFVFEIND